MIYAVVDTNVLVSALWTKNDQSATFRVAKLLQEGKFMALYNEQILAEYEDVLSRPKFNSIVWLLTRLLPMYKSMMCIRSDCFMMRRCQMRMTVCSMRWS